MIVDHLTLIDSALIMNRAEYAAILIVICIASLVIGILSLRKMEIPGAASLLLLSAAVAVWALVYLAPASPYRISPLVETSAIYLSVTAAATGLLTFALTYSNRSRWLSNRAKVLLAIFPLATQLLFWANPWREILFTNPNLPIEPFALSAGIWTKIFFFYLYNFELISIILLIYTFTRKSRKLFFQSGMILLGAVAPFLIQLFGHVGILPIEYFKYLHLAYSLSVLAFAYTLHRGELIETLALSRDAIVEGMTDGWMVLDANDTIIDINPAAESIVGFSGAKVYGKPVQSVLTELSGLSDAVGGMKEIDMRRSVRTKTEWRYLNIRLSNLRDHNQTPFGKLILWRDITERRLADDARQRARDEMFAILNAISNAATHTSNLEEFLSEAIFQIIYPFDSQLAAVFLVDEDDADIATKKLNLASQIGLTPEALQSMAEIRVIPSLFEMLVNQRRTLLIDDLPSEVRIRFEMRGLGISNFLLIPLTIRTGRGNKIIGCLGLARKEQVLYSQDEIIRLSTIADQIATFIDSDRRRQLSISLLERQRLLRDLHDSVSQKLYGLVTLTEAAQAALEAGSSVIPFDVLKKIGDNARLAVKEMRLFLYEMQPVDLEKEGLVSILHHRLAAVEGRADIQARLLADDNITLVKETEIALYYVAQEALNNILKHAHAKSVSVILRQTQRNVILEVVDDGRGFDPKRVEPGGMGLRNIMERIALVHGTVRIESQIGSGTRIKVTVGRERSYIQKRSRRKS